MAELAAAIAVGKYGVCIGFMNWDGCVVCALLVRGTIVGFQEHAAVVCSTADRPCWLLTLA